MGRNEDQENSTKKSEAAKTISSLINSQVMKNAGVIKKKFMMDSRRHRDFSQYSVGSQLNRHRPIRVLGTA